MIRYRDPTIDFHDWASPSSFWSLVLLWSLVLGVWTFCPARSFAAEPSSPRQRLSFNSNWLFIKGDPTNSEAKLDYQTLKPGLTTASADLSTNTQPAKFTGSPGTNVPYAQASFDDSRWRKLNLPHDWGIEGPFKQEYPGETGKLPWWGIGWYRKHFTLPPEDHDRKIYLDVDGAMAYSAVWLNGQFVGGWPYGYASFELDLTPFIDYGRENVLAIRLDNPPDSSRWYPGGGIYRNVWLVKTAPIHVGHWGTYVTTQGIDISAAAVDLKVTVDNDSKSPATLTLKTQIYELGSV